MKLMLIILLTEPSHQKTVGREQRVCSWLLVYAANSSIGSSAANTGLIYDKEFNTPRFNRVESTVDRGLCDVMISIV